MRIDAHQHFWKYDAAEYPWIPPGSVLQRDFLPPDLEPLLRAAGVDRCIAVQARQTVEESRWLLELAEHHSIIGGVVGWVDLRSAEVDAQLERFADHPKFVGVRHVIQDEPDDEFALGKAFREGVGRLKEHGLTYDLLIYPKQLPAAIKLVQQFPQQPFVLDHIAKPNIKEQRMEPWATQIRELGKAPNVFCKISGMVTEARRHEWKAADFRPYLEVVWEAFGEDRLMAGSDWPVCLLGGSYADVMRLATDYLQQFSAATQEKVLGGNAVRFYGLASSILSK